MVANGMCNEADLQALSNLKRSLSGSMILKVIFKSHVKLEESWWEACETVEWSGGAFKELEKRHCSDFSMTCL